MKRFSLVFILLLFVLPSFAQDDEQSPYEIALQRIEEARVSGATSLDLSNLGLIELPPEMGRLVNLNRLYLSDNRLDSLPPEIGNLSNLQLLWLQNNQLGTLPSDIGNLTNLQALFLENNQLNSLPAEVGKLDNLRWLFLDNNELNSLPSEMGNMSRLCVLRLNNNRLQYLPINISQLDSLRETECHLYLGTGNIYFADGIGFTDGISLDGNPLISPPQAVIDQGTAAILAYLRNEAWWHINRLIAGAASSVGLVAAIILGFRWKNRHDKKKNS